MVVLERVKPELSKENMKTRDRDQTKTVSHLTDRIQMWPGVMTVKVKLSGRNT